MPVQVAATPTFQKLYRDIPTAIQRKADRKIALFKEQPFHPTLRTEKLHPKHKEVWSFRIDYEYRILFRFLSPTSVHLLFIGHHNRIYRYLDLLT